MFHKKPNLISVMTIRSNIERVEQLAISLGARTIGRITHKANNSVEVTYSFMNESNSHQFMKRISGFPRLDR